MNEIEKKEIDEAIAAIDVTLNYLNQARDLISSAGNWGLLDLFGGGFFSTAVKHCRMKDATMALEKAKKSVSQLKKELADVNESLSFEIKIDSFLSFADYFFDGIASDWLVQSKINKAEEQVIQAINHLKQIKSQLLEIH